MKSAKKVRKEIRKHLQEIEMKSAKKVRKEIRKHLQEILDKTFELDKNPRKSSVDDDNWYTFTKGIARCIEALSDPTQRDGDLEETFFNFVNEVASILELPNMDYCPTGEDVGELLGGED